MFEQDYAGLKDLTGLTLEFYPVHPSILHNHVQNRFAV